MPEVSVILPFYNRIQYLQDSLESIFCQDFKDFEIIAVDKASGQDLCDPKLTQSLPDCDVVVHMAATNGTKLFYEIPTDVAFNNTIPTFNLIKRFRNTNF